MRDFAILFIHLIATIAKLIGPGGARAVIAESLLVKHQLIILNRGRKRAPNLGPQDRIIAGLSTLFIRPSRLVLEKTHCCRAEAFYPPRLPRHAGETQIPAPVLTEATR